MLSNIGNTLLSLNILIGISIIYFSFNNLNYISQFPLTSQFMSAGIDIDNDEELLF